MLTVSQVFSTIAFSIKSLNGLNPISGMISFVIGTVMNFIAIIPFYLLCRRYGNGSLLNFSYKIFGKFGYIIAVLFLLILLSTAISTVVVFEDFLSSTVLKNSSFFVIILLLVVASVYGAFLGIEALGRFANIVFVLLCLSVLGIFLAIVKDIELVNFGGFSMNSTSRIFETAVQGIFANTGLLSAVLLTPLVNKKHTKGFTVWNVVSLVIVEIIVFSVTGVLGEYAAGKEYPYYSTATVAEFSILKRLDIVYMCVWVLVAFIKTTYYLLLSKNVLDSFLHNSAKKYSLFFCTAIMLVVSLICSIRPILYEYIQTFISSGIGTILLIALPIFFLFAGGKRNEKN